MENKDSVVAIGARLQGNIYANGAITEASIWSKTLSAAEVTELYKLSAAKVKLIPVALGSTDSV